MAVYTVVSETQLAHLLAQYDIGVAVHFDGITHGVENSNYRLTTTKGEFILTLYERRVQPADLPFFIGLMGHYSAAGITCPKPIADRNGVILQRVSGRAAAVFSCLEGEWSTTPSLARCQQVGRILAEMQQHGRGYSGHRVNALGANRWQGLLDSIDSALADRLLPNICSITQNRLTDTLAHWPQDLPRGVIHADLFMDNVLFSGEKLTGVIDFYFACNDILAYDLAITLNAWAFDEGEFNRAKAQALIAGYQSLRPLTTAEIAAFPILCRGAAMRFFLTRLYDWIHTPADAQVHPHDPMEYEVRLNFHHGVESPSAYGL